MEKKMMENLKSLSQLNLTIANQESHHLDVLAQMDLPNYTGYYLRKEQKESIHKTCVLCGGSGLILNQDGLAERCACVKNKLLEEKRKRANVLPALAKMSFENFRLAYYPANQVPLNSQGLSKSYHAFGKNAKERAEQFVANVQINKNIKGLLLQGPVGSGKTHLAAAIANALLEKTQIKTLFLVVPDFLEEIRSAYGDDGGETENTIMSRVKNAQVLILDDLGSHNFSDWTKNKIFSLLNYRLNNELPCVVTTNLDIDSLNKILGQRIVSRLIACCDPIMIFVPEDIRLSQNRVDG